jgi:hypothetical protein
MKKLHVIGWREKVNLPEWDIQGLLAKSDTGANSSAIDVAWLEEGGDGLVRFGVRLSRKYPDRIQVVESRIVRTTRIRSSNGVRAHRVFVETEILIGRVRKRVEFGLVCRKKMLCRVLLGRKALEGDFLVDCSDRHLHADDATPPSMVRIKPGIPKASK